MRALVLKGAHPREKTIFETKVGLTHVWASFEGPGAKR